MPTAPPATVPAWAHDYKEVVARVCALAAAPAAGAAAAIDPAGAEDVARAYAEWCRQSNERLRRCLEYLYRRQRPAALHLARVDPPLEELVAALESVPAERWSDLCRALRLAAPPRVLKSALAELTQAAAAAAPLEDLLARHRTLALARAPLRERLDVLRAIAEADRKNHAWQEDLAAYELARLAEVDGGLVAASGGPALRALRDELAAPTWTPRADPRRREVQRRLERALEDAAMRGFEALLPELSAARDADDPERVAAAIAGWRAAWPEAADVDADLWPDPLRAALRDANAWIDSARQRQRVEERRLRAQQVLSEQTAGRGARGERIRRALITTAVILALGAAAVGLLHWLKT
jgi:hypothetical protein